MKISIKGFTIIEIIISISILIVLAVIVVTYSEWMRDKSYNSKILSEVWTLENTLQVFYDDSQTPLFPSWNKKFFQADTTYAHDESDAYGVSGFFSDTTLPKKYLPYTPIDPRSNQYYAFATTLTGGFFEISGIVKVNNQFQAKVSGNYPWDMYMQNLIREYNGPNFVFEGSLNHLPYNPNERILTAKINSFSWNILINNIAYTSEEITTLNLFEWDRLKVGTWWYAEIYMSDGSVSTLGDETLESEMVFSNMRFLEDGNLITQVKLALNMGSLWTKAAKLSEKSQFEVYTIDSVAAVRGTIFWVRKVPNQNTNTVVIQGNVKVDDILIPFMVSPVPVDEILKNETFSTGTIANGEIIVAKNEDPKGILTIASLESIASISTGALIEIPSEVKVKIENQAWSINSNIPLEIESFNGNTPELKIKINPILSTATKILINENIFWNIPSYMSGDILSLTGSTLWYTWSKIISLCDNNACTKPLKIDLENKISFIKSDLTPIYEAKPLIKNLCNGIINGDCGENLMGTDWKVFAYAGFNNSWDLSLKTLSGSIPEYSEWILNNLCNVKLVDDVFSKFYDSACSDSIVYITRLQNFTNTYNIWTSFFDVKNKDFKGILLDNKDLDDTLKYDFSSAPLYDFILETQVRKEALERTGAEYYYLFDGWNHMRLYQQNGKITLFTWIAHSWFINPSNLKEINTIQLIRKNYQIALKINDTIVLDSIASSSPIYALYVGNKFNLSNAYDQWNDLLNYAKVYVKNE